MAETGGARAARGGVYSNSGGRVLVPVPDASARDRGQAARRNGAFGDDAKREDGNSAGTPLPTAHARRRTDRSLAGPAAGRSPMRCAAGSPLEDRPDRSVSYTGGSSSRGSGEAVRGVDRYALLLASARQSEAELGRHAPAKGTDERAMDAVSGLRLRASIWKERRQKEERPVGLADTPTPDASSQSAASSRPPNVGLNEGGGAEEKDALDAYTLHFARSDAAALSASPKARGRPRPVAALAARAGARPRGQGASGEAAQPQGVPHSSSRPPAVPPLRVLPVEAANDSSGAHPRRRRRARRVTAPEPASHDRSWIQQSAAMLLSPQSRPELALATAQRAAALRSAAALPRGGDGPRPARRRHRHQQQQQHRWRQYWQEGPATARPPPLHVPSSPPGTDGSLSARAPLRPLRPTRRRHGEAFRSPTLHLWAEMSEGAATQARFSDADDGGVRVGSIAARAREVLGRTGRRAAESAPSEDHPLLPPLEGEEGAAAAASPGAVESVAVVENTPEGRALVAAFPDQYRVRSAPWEECATPAPGPPRPPPRPPAAKGAHQGPSRPPVALIEGGRRRWERRRVPHEAGKQRPVPRPLIIQRGSFSTPVRVRTRLRDAPSSVPTDKAAGAAGGAERDERAAKQRSADEEQKGSETTKGATEQYSAGENAERKGSAAAPTGRGHTMEEEEERSGVLDSQLGASTSLAHAASPSVQQSAALPVAAALKALPQQVARLRKLVSASALPRSVREQAAAHLRTIHAASFLSPEQSASMAVVRAMRGAGPVTSARASGLLPASSSALAPKPSGGTLVTEEGRGEGEEREGDEEGADAAREAALRASTPALRLAASDTTAALQRGMAAAAGAWKDASGGGPLSYAELVSGRFHELALVRQRMKRLQCVRAQQTTRSKAALQAAEEAAEEAAGWRGAAEPVEKEVVVLDKERTRLRQRTKVIAQEAYRLQQRLYELRAARTEAVRRVSAARERHSKLRQQVVEADAARQEVEEGLRSGHLRPAGEMEEARGRARKAQRASRELRVEHRRELERCSELHAQTREAERVMSGLLGGVAASGSLASILTHRPPWHLYRHALHLDLAERLAVRQERAAPSAGAAGDRPTSASSTSSSSSSSSTSPDGGVRSADKPKSRARTEEARRKQREARLRAIFGTVANTTAQPRRHPSNEPGGEGSALHGESAFRAAVHARQWAAHSARRARSRRHTGRAPWRDMERREDLDSAFEVRTEKDVFARRAAEDASRARDREARAAQLAARDRDESAPPGERAGTACRSWMALVSAVRWSHLAGPGPVRAAEGGPRSSGWDAVRRHLLHRPNRSHPAGAQGEDAEHKASRRERRRLARERRARARERRAFARERWWGDWPLLTADAGWARADVEEEGGEGKEGTGSERGHSTPGLPQAVVTALCGTVSHAGASSALGARRGAALEDGKWHNAAPVGLHRPLAGPGGEKSGEEGKEQEPPALASALRGAQVHLRTTELTADDLIGFQGQDAGGEDARSLSTAERVAALAELARHRGRESFGVWPYPRLRRCLSPHFPLLPCPPLQRPSARRLAALPRRWPRRPRPGTACWPCGRSWSRPCSGRARRRRTLRGRRCRRARARRDSPRWGTI